MHSILWIFFNKTYETEYIISIFYLCMYLYPMPEKSFGVWTLDDICVSLVDLARNVVENRQIENHFRTLVIVENA